MPIQIQACWVMDPTLEIHGSFSHDYFIDTKHHAFADLATSFHALRPSTVLILRISGWATQLHYNTMSCYMYYMNQQLTFPLVQ